MTTEAHRCCVVRESWPEQIEREARERIARGFQTADDRAAAVRSELWMPGQTIHVSFMRHGATAAFLEAPDAIEAQVRTIANEWTTYANLSFAFDDSAAGIRISFRDDGSWSLLGRRCLAVRRDEATMNFGWLSRRLDPGEFRRVVLHEFGHALGLIHEHQNPTGGIKWRRDVILAFYRGPPNNWSDHDVQRNVFEAYDVDRTRYTSTDRTSIMMYPIPPEHTEDGYSVGWNRDLSETDKRFIAELYPRAAMP